MPDEASRLLEPGERLLWRCSTARRERRRAEQIVQIFGHASFSLITLGGTALLCSWPRGELRVKLALGLGLCFALNAALAAFSILRRRGRAPTSDVGQFLTDRRMVVLNPGGGLRQLPLVPQVEIRWGATSVEFRLPGHAPISIEDMTAGETELLKMALDNLARARTDSDAENGEQIEERPAAEEGDAAQTQE